MLCSVIRLVFILVVVKPVEPIGFSGLQAGLAAIGSAAYTYYVNIKCKFKVCCSHEWIKDDLKGLTKDLSDKLHGQHLVERTVVGHLKGHLQAKNPPKALVLSFHGVTGVGKNFVSKIIAENLYKGGLHSEFVHTIVATREFPHEGMIPFYKETLKSWIESNVSLCARSMFIFDEVDKLPALLLDVIKPYLDHYEHLGGIDYRKSIFIFLSNAGGHDIARIMHQHWKDGKPRAELELREVEDKIMLAAINQDSHSGLWHSQLISNHLITAFIPFLPLEKEHIKNCTKDVLLLKHYNKKTKQKLIDRVIQELNFWPDSGQVFSTTGCKRVAEKVDYVLMDDEFEEVPSKHEL